ncbi:MAG: alpha-hydroxy-acid oxidizing protein [Clostridium sp.]
MTVFIRRPFVTASFGGHSKGAKVYIQELKVELKSAMGLTKCKDIKSVDDRIIFRKQLQP